MSGEKHKPLMRSLGEFVGHIWKGFRSDVPSSGRQVVRHDVEQETRDTAQGKVTLRRTTIEEVEVRPPPSTPHLSGDP